MGNREMAHACRLVLFAAALASPGALAQAPSIYDRPFQRASENYFALLMIGRYDNIELLLQKARAGDEQISDGQPVLAAIYGGTAGCMTQGCTNRLSDERWVARRHKLEEWAERYPDSVGARVALASFPIEYAWFARGQGYSSTVDKDAWRLFGERIAAARKALEGLDHAAKDDPGWSYAMLNVGLAQRWPREQFGSLYERAATRHPYYVPIHFAGSAYYAPKWYGSVAELRGFIERAVERTAPRWGETLYARLNWSLWTGEMFQNGQADWQRMKAGFERIVKDHPDPWNVNNYARFACHAGDLKTAAALIQAIGGKPIAAAWYNDLRYYDQCRASVERAAKR